MPAPKFRFGLSQVSAAELNLVRLGKVKPSKPLKPSKAPENSQKPLNLEPPLQPMNLLLKGRLDFRV